jgi:hypothetical protein
LSETRDAFGPLLERLQAEVRDLRAEFRSLRAEVRSERTATRELVKLRAEETETYISGLFETLNKRMDQTERSFEERLARIEKLLERP